jgi:hypothetical protein
VRDLVAPVERDLSRQFNNLDSLVQFRARRLRIELRSFCGHDLIRSLRLTPPSMCLYHRELSFIQKHFVCLPALDYTEIMPHELPKAYEPGAIETRWAEYWKHEKLFHAATPPAGHARNMFSLLLPPPNVTGRLHMGHMLNQTEMDIIIRWHRMRGDLTLWLPGTSSCLTSRSEIAVPQSGHQFTMYFPR